MIDVEDNEEITVTRAQIEQSVNKTALDNGDKRRTDRRRRVASVDPRGLINEPAYRGMDRRSGVDRRDVGRKNEDLIRRDRINFVKRTVTYSFIITTFFAAVIFVLFTPEYIKIREFVKTFDFKAAVAQLDFGEKFYFEGFLNRQIEGAENYVLGVSSAVEEAAASRGGTDVSAYSNVFDRIRKIDTLSSDDRYAAKQSIGSLRDIVLSSFNGNPRELATAVQNATDYDKVLRNVLEPVKNKNMAAAAMLIVLNEFRDNIYSGNSYESDIKVIRKLAGNDPELNASIDKLLPYAKKGVMSQEKLTQEFKSLSQEIILAKIKGQDANVKERAMQRFEEISKQVQAGQSTDESEEAVVARAQYMLNNNNVQGAMTELKKLQGDSATQASGWMQNASTSVDASDSSSFVVQQLVKNIAGSSGISSQGLLQSILGKTSLGGAQSGGTADFSFVAK